MRLLSVGYGSKGPLYCVQRCLGLRMRQGYTWATARSWGSLCGWSPPRLAGRRLMYSSFRRTWPLAGSGADRYRAERISVDDASVLRFRACVRASRLGVLRCGKRRQRPGAKTNAWLVWSSGGVLVTAHVEVVVAPCHLEKCLPFCRAWSLLRETDL